MFAARGFRYALMFLMVLVGLVAGFQFAPSFLSILEFATASTPAAKTSTWILRNDEFRMTVRLGLTAVGGLFGVILASEGYRIVSALTHAMERMPSREKVAITVGCLIGVVVTLPFAAVFSRFGTLALPLTLTVGVLLIYLSINAILSMKELGLLLPSVQGSDSGNTPRIKILDTNVIIDGRISDVSKCGFLEGVIYVPGFVIDELQYIADSADPLRRARGRRGLDILNALQKERRLEIRTWDDLANVSEPVDKRLVILAKELNGMIVTNDFNLNKVAELEGVKVLNVNELANALKPVVLPGELMRVRIIKEGNQANQGVGYLDDGTMIVVENGRDLIDQEVDVAVSSVLQTVAGKMIFASVRSTIGSDEGMDVYSTDPVNGRGRRRLK